ncbi:hypothetical protein TNCV_3078561 [Trichonephila clavipes]|nr:hypothetical protein TNCV_3078561 [Trichonephila clavipes]
MNVCSSEVNVGFSGAPSCAKNVCSKQLPLNVFHGYMVRKVGIHLGRYLWQCSLAFSDDFSLKHPPLMVLRRSLTIVLLRRHLAQIYVDFH